MYLLLIEDDPAAAAAVATALRAHGHAVTHAATGAEGLLRARSEVFDLVLLDLLLPDGDGLGVLGGLRSARLGVPVIVLSALQGVEARVRALDSGADDVLVRPVALAELVARIEAVARRGRKAPMDVLERGRLRLDRNARQVSADGVRLALSGMEFALLELLMRQAPAAVSREQIEGVLYGDRPRGPQALNVFVGKLRRKLSATLGFNTISTRWGQGYMLDDSPPGVKTARGGVAAVPSPLRTRTRSRGSARRAPPAPGPRQG